jgi:hypothetical protein
MAEETKQVEKIPYDQFLKDDLWLDAAYNSLRDLGEDVSEDPKDILDTFLTKSRYIDTNLYSAYNTANKVTDLDDDGKKLLGYSLEKIKRLPDFYEKGGASSLGAITDYAIAGVSDPTNIAAAIATIFTGGGATPVTVGGRVAAQTTARAVISSRLKAALSKPVLAALGTEALIAGAGGAGQEKYRQDIEMETGIRDKSKGYDLESIALSGLLEGVASPIATILTKEVGSLVGKGIKGGTKALAEKSTAVNNSVEYLKRNFLPTAGLPQSTVRAFETGTGGVKDLKESSAKLGQDIQNIVDNDFKDTLKAEVPNTGGKTNLDMIYASMEGDAVADDIVRQTSPNLAAKIEEFKVLRAKATDYAVSSDTTGLIKGYFTRNNNNNYLRNVPEVYAVNRRQVSFKDFIKENPNIYNEVESLVRTNPDKYSSMPEFSEIYVQGQVVAPDAKVKSQVEKYVKNLYTPSRARKKETGSFGPTLETQGIVLPDSIKKILGYNNRPGIRAAETISGIVDTVSKINIANDIANDAINFGTGVRLQNMPRNFKLNDKKTLASNQLNGEEVVPLVQFIQKNKSKVKDGEDITPFMFDKRFVNDELKDIFITKTYAKQLKTLMGDDFIGQEFIKRDDVYGSAYRGLVRIQTAAKAGKTIYNPLAFPRNAIGAAGYVAASGNAKGAWDSIRLLTKDKAKFKREFEEFTKQGLAGSNIDLNQLSKRLSTFSSEYDPTKLDQFLNYGKAGRGARKLYGATDDYAKFFIWSGEKAKAKRHYPTLSEAEINSIAANKTALVSPIYDRIPPIFEKMRAIPVVGSFVAYPAERLRNTYNIFKLGGDEITEGINTGNKELVKSGVNRMAKWYATQGAFYGSAMLANEQGLFMDGEDVSDVVDILREHLPDWKKDNPIIITGKKMVDGRPVYEYRDLGYLNPDQYIVNSVMPFILKAARGEDVSKDIGESFKRAANNLVSPYIGTTLAANFGKDLVDWFGDPDDEAKLGKALKSIEPGFVKAIREGAIDLGAAPYVVEKTFRPPKFGQGEERRADGAVDALNRQGLNPVSFFGMRKEEFDPLLAAGFTLSQLNRNTKGDWSAYVGNLKKTLGDPLSTYSEVSLLNDYNDLLKDQYEKQKVQYKLLRDLNNLGMDRGDLNRLFKKQGLSAVAPSNDELLGNMNGMFVAPKLGRSKENWKDILKYLKGTSNFNEMRKEVIEFRNKIKEIEYMYNRRDLREEAPDINIEERQ